jgi:hypothetical protein
MSLERSLFERVEFFYSSYGRSSNEGVLIKFFNMTQGVTAEDTENAIFALVNMGLVQSHGLAPNIEIIPTDKGMLIVKNGTLDDFLAKKGL